MDNKNNKFEFRGLISGEIPVLLKIEHEKYNPEKISTELILLDNSEKLGRTFNGCLSGDDYGNLKIFSEKDSQPEVTLKGIHGWSHQGNNASLVIDSYEYAISEVPIKNPENIHVLVELTPGGILKKWGAREFYNGNINPQNGYPEEIEWDFTIGKGKAFTRYTYEEHNVFDNKATLQIERPSLTFEIKTDSNLSTAKIKDEIEKEAIDFSLILSLCYRKLVSWYEIDFTIVPSDKNLSAISPVIRKKVYKETYPDHEDELINHRDLINGGLPTLVENFRNSPQIESLRRSIIFLASSQSNQTIEVKYFLSIISLESFCDGFIELVLFQLNIPKLIKWAMITSTLFISPSKVAIDSTSSFRM